jgi:uncharacterized protein YfkK (UPF0435 family)
MRNIKLNKEDIKYLIENLEIPSEILQKLKLLQEGKIKPEDVSIDDYDLLRDLCGERLQIYGFDENYNPTKEGLILEDLVDKLFTG